MNDQVQSNEHSVLAVAGERVTRWTSGERFSDLYPISGETSFQMDVQTFLSALKAWGLALERIAHPQYGLGFNKLRGIARACLQGEKP